MPKPPRLTAGDAVKLLEKRGFILVRQSGSHMIYRNKEGVRATVPSHGSKILHPKIIKQILADLKINIYDHEKTNI